jgi:hypothetical protein
MTKTCSLVGPFNETGDIGDGKRREIDFMTSTVKRFHHTQDRIQSRKRIIGDLWPCVGDLGEKGGFSRIRLPDQSHIGQEFELQLHKTFLPRLSRIGPAGGSVGRGFKVDVSPPPTSPLRGDKFLTDLREIFEKPPVFVFDEGADGDADNEIIAGLSVLVLSTPVFPAGCLEFSTIAKVREGGELGIGDKDDTSPRPPVTAIGSAAGLMGLAAKGGTALPPVASLYENSRLVDKPHGISSTDGTML